MDRIGSLYDCSRLTQFLSTSLSKLKTIEWIDESGGYSHGTKIPFGSFRGFTQLEELTLYYQDLVAWMTGSISEDRIHPEHLIQPEPSLPVSLKVLKIKNVLLIVLKGL
ncbi:unnamed protein product [Alternaria alternata]